MRSGKVKKQNPDLAGSYFTHDGREMKIQNMPYPYLANAVRVLEKRLAALKRELKFREFERKL